MKAFLRGLKLFFAFLCISFALLEIWNASKRTYDIPDKGLLLVGAIFSIGVTILWMEVKKA
jgi:hypothetical protein